MSTIRTRRTPSWATLPAPEVGTPEHRALIAHSIDAYADPTRRFRLSPREIRDTAEGLRDHAARYRLAVPHYLGIWGVARWRRSPRPTADDEAP